MPEIVEAFVIAKSLDIALSGNPIVNKFSIQGLKIENPNRYQIDGTITTSVFSRGKKVIFSQHSPSIKRDIFIIFSLSMTGIFRDTDSGHTKLIIEYENRTIYFDDVRGFASAEITDNYNDLLNSSMGQDLIQDNITLEKWLEKINNAGQRLSIYAFMMEQRNFAGIGQYLSQDILYDSGIMYNRKIGTLTDEEKIRLFESTQRIIKTSLEEKGHSIKDYVDFEGNLGTYKPLVYGQKRDPLGNKVVTKKVGNRTMYYVPDIQN